MPEEQPEAPKHSLSQEQKIGFVFLLVFGIVGLILGVLQIRNTIFAPFALTNSIPASVKENVNDVSALRYRDTDQDGLSDYDELYQYDTSPYLFDSFGYGISDKEVVAKGYARCANAGKNCTNESTPIASPFATSTELVGTGEENLAVLDVNKLLSDPVQVRALLIANGMDKKILDGINDQDLMMMVGQLLTSSTISTTTNL